ncbi:reverse transcriptase family protein [Pseudomonas guariconensis]|uniref:reverse transcriptase family protein n=1 Tax=Pseudomonas guariconensis TaxID=1288410 RepID=UPI0034660820
MRRQQSSVKKRKSFKLYAINQSALYKLTSPKKLAETLSRTELEISNLLNSDENYREFTLLEEYNPFSQKRKKARLVQTPNKALRVVHERILKLLQRIEYPDYAHAGVKKRSYRSNAQAHVNAKTVATFDLSDFYSSVKAHHVYSFYLNNLKCVRDVAGHLTKLSTHKNCIPTGSPLSPLLALYSMQSMFDSLALLAKRHDLTFTCYVDDLTFSGDAIPTSLEREVISIVRRHGHSINTKKTRIFKENQPKHITGTVIINGRITVPHARLLTVRRLEAAINGRIESYGFSEVKLMEKLAGVLNEASYLDPKFRSKALSARATLAESVS